MMAASTGYSFSSMICLSPIHALSNPFAVESISLFGSLHAKKTTLNFIRDDNSQIRRYLRSALFRQLAKADLLVLDDF
jgi:hypothetical protein